METYVVQLFPPALSGETSAPLLVRVPQNATVADLLDITVAEHQQLLNDVGVSDANDYMALVAVHPADGNGAPASDAPLGLDEVLRECPRLDFPFMIALVAHREIPPTAPSPQSVATEKARREAIEQRRQANVTRMEQAQQKAELERFRKCEAIEVMRREQIRKQKQAEETVRQAQAAAELEERRRAEVAEQLLRDQRDNDLAKQKQRLAELQAAEEARLRDARAKEQQRNDELHAAQRREAELKRIALEETAEARMKSSLDQLLNDLDQKVLSACDTATTEQLSLRNRRAEESVAARQRADIRTLETVATAARLQQRSHRWAAEASLNETLAQSRINEDSSAAEARMRDAEQYASWQSQRSTMTSQLESHLELQFREGRRAAA
jgi:hypothetical protein